jgi:NIMA (never in mitosis gene a)-related kinase
MSLSRFEVLGLIGQGAYSLVYRVRRLRDGKIYALKKVKILDLSDKERLNALNEVRLLASISHPNIVAYKEAFIDEDSQTLW